jgi:TatD DNase family protein
MTEFVDTHCHVQFTDYPLDTQLVVDEAQRAGVTRLLCVGCRLEDSQAAVKLAQQDERCWASIGLHPHEAKHYVGNTQALEAFTDLARQPRVVAIGECGLDYYYTHSPKADQIKILEYQLDLAKNHNLPVIFHVRDAFDDFWPIFDNFTGIKGVIHSFTAGTKRLEQVLSRGLYVGLNGIMTFTKDEAQLQMVKQVPLEKLLLETDAPFLTPVPFRGTICEPKHVVETAKYLAALRGEDIDQLAAGTTTNARSLFGI